MQVIYENKTIKYEKLMVTQIYFRFHIFRIEYFIYLFQHTVKSHSMILVFIAFNFIAGI